MKFTPDRWREIERLFQAVIGLPADKRAAHMDEIGSDPVVRREVESLLGGLALGERVLETPHGEPLPGQPGHYGPGTIVEHYRLIEKIGAGGMGEVYRARDTKLDRDVAIKILIGAFAGSPQRRARFEREAKILAALNHPHIAAIYGVEESVLVMELAEGEAPRGPMPVPEVLALARQLADALDYAHERGIVHRDLKPANLKVTADGKLKVLDFGLARAMTDHTATDSTVTQGLTMQGMIMGTPGYMSPEQARGETVDKRSDIWSFGVVLYELLTGRKAFPGKTPSESVAAVLMMEPDWAGLPSGSPLKLLRRCLEKDPKRRLRDIGEAKILLDAPEEEPERSRPWGWMAAAILGVALIALAVLHFGPGPAEATLTRLSITPPAGAANFDLGTGATVALSPDGKRVVFSALSASGVTQLWVRALDNVAARPLAGTERARNPFWSPDSRYIAFQADERLKKIDANGGPVQVVAKAPFLRGGTWNREGVIIYQPEAGLGGPLMRVPASGGTAVPVSTQPIADRQFNAPWFLPDGRHFLFCEYGAGRQIRVGSLDSADSQIVVADTQTSAIYASGHLLFARGDALMAQPFDADRLRVTGEPVPVAETVHHRPSASVGLFSASVTGLLVYAPGQSTSLGLTWFDLNGTRFSNELQEGLGSSPHQLSPDRSKVAMEFVEAGNTDIWIRDLARGTSSRFTFDSAREMAPVWSPDGRFIVFSSNRKGHLDLYRKPSDGSGPEELLYADEWDKAATSWSPDGRSLLYEQYPSGTLYVLPETPPAGGGAVRPSLWMQVKFAGGDARFSPDGRWVAYVSVETGRSEVYVASFPGATGKKQVSTNGGLLPRWRPDGKALFFVNTTTAKLTSVDANSRGATMEFGTPKALFGELRGNALAFEVSADGRRFLAKVPPEDRSERVLNVVQNWPAALRK